jgi:hypothetical protein
MARVEIESLRSLIMRRLDPLLPSEHAGRIAEEATVRGGRL